MLVQHPSTGTLPDADDAVIEDRTATEASGVGDQQRDFDLPHASSDGAVALKLFEPVSTRVRLTQADVQSGVIQAGVLKNSDDFAGSSRVVESAIDGLIGFHTH